MTKQQVVISSPGVVTRSCNSKLTAAVMTVKMDAEGGGETPAPRPSLAEKPADDNHNESLEKKDDAVEEEEDRSVASLTSNEEGTAAMKEPPLTCRRGKRNKNSSHDSIEKALAVTPSPPKQQSAEDANNKPTENASPESITKEEGATAVAVASPPSIDTPINASTTAKKMDTTIEEGVAAAASSSPKKRTASAEDKKDSSDEQPRRKKRRKIMVVVVAAAVAAGVAYKTFHNAKNGLRGAGPGPTALLLEEEKATAATATKEEDVLPKAPTSSRLKKRIVGAVGSRINPFVGAVFKGAMGALRDATSPLMIYQREREEEEEEKN